MKVSRIWLQRFFEKELPSTEAISDALTFHVFEIEEIEKKGDDEVLDVKVLPDRAAYGLSHRGVASELSAILGVPMKSDPLRESLPEWNKSNALSVSVESDKCLRFVAAVVRGVKVGPSPAWLKEALEAVGQRSINNVVDATNFVMINMGQPLHAFDARKLTEKDGAYALNVRAAKDGEKITTLSNEEFTLSSNILVVADAHTDAALGIGGVKGGKAAEITADTTDIILEAGNFDGTMVRKTSQTLKLWTDASLRFQNRPSPELAAYGMRDVIALVLEIAGGELEGVVDVYPTPAQQASVSVSLEKINGILGSVFSAEDVTNVFDKLGFIYTQDSDSFTVTASFERRDITIPEDIAEEVGRIIGYESIPGAILPALLTSPDQARYRGIERIKDFLIERGFTELSTQSFATDGHIYLANPLDQTKPALRATLSENMNEALTRAATVAPKVLGPATALKLFDIGMVFAKDSEHLSLAIGYAPLSGKKQSMLAEITDALSEEFGELSLSSSDTVVETNLDALDLASLGASYEPIKIRLGAYKPFSIYPFALRDIAVWTPAGTEESEVQGIIVKEAEDLLVRIDLFDRFEKEGRISYAFRLVFESPERTLSDADLDPLMQRVANALNSNDGWEVR